MFELAIFSHDDFFNLCTRDTSSHYLNQSPPQRVFSSFRQASNPSLQNMIYISVPKIISFLLFSLFFSFCFPSYFHSSFPLKLLSLFLDSMLVPGTHRAAVVVELHASIYPRGILCKEVGRQLEKARRLQMVTKALFSVKNVGKSWVEAPQASILSWEGSAKPWCPWAKVNSQRVPSLPESTLLSTSHIPGGVQL